MISPGIHDVTKSKAAEWKKLGIAEDAKEDGQALKSTNPPKKTQAEQMEEGMFEQLQEEAKALGIETGGKDFETLKAEVEGFVE